MKTTKILLNEWTEIEVTQGIREVEEKIVRETWGNWDTNYITLMRKEEKRFLYFFRDVRFYQIKLNLKRILFFYENQDG